MSPPRGSSSPMEVAMCEEAEMIERKRRADQTLSENASSPKVRHVNSNFYHINYASFL